MIQRIQTLYLLAISISMGLLLFSPVAQVVVPNDMTYNFYTYGVIDITGQDPEPIYYWALLVLNLITILLPLVTIFLYKKRFLQIRLCIVEIILLLGCCGMMVYLIRHFSQELEANILYKTGLIIPIICVIFTYMAMKGIWRDIRLVKSYDRIR